MGQYYHALILAEKTKEADKEFIRAAIHSHMFDDGMKLVEHSYINSSFMTAIEYLLSPLGIFYKSRLVWAGDYADPEPGSEQNLHNLSEGKEFSPSPRINFSQIMQRYNFIVNHTKKQYVTKTGRVYHPLSLLTAEGNGRGGGDYHGSCDDLIGIWARDVISVELTAPADYAEIVCNFGMELFK
jgi:hypothetical protein